MRHGITINIFLKTTIKVAADTKTQLKFSRRYDELFTEQQHEVFKSRIQKEDYQVYEKRSLVCAGRQSLTSTGVCAQRGWGDLWDF